MEQQGRTKGNSWFIRGFGEDPLREEFPFSLGHLHLFGKIITRLEGVELSPSLILPGGMGTVCGPLLIELMCGKIKIHR